MGHLFVSYASVDRGRMLEVVDAVRSHGIEVWIDQAGIAGGTAYGTEIASALRDADAVLLIASDASLASKNVRQEIMLAWRYDRPILPLILHPLVFPDDVAYWLEGAQWIEVFDRPADEWLPKLWQALARHGIGNTPVETTSAPSVLPALEIPGNLPASTPAIFGRAREIEEVLTLLANGRTITLTGPGGTGKTRLALEVGQRIGPSYAGGAWVLELATTHAADLVLPAIAALLDVDVPPDQPVADAIGAALAGTPTLLILDNLEHILEVADDLDRLQEQAPDLTLLMTSRAPLGLAREWVYAVPQLALPDLEALPAPSVLLENPAVQLFVTRAQQAKADFQLIDGDARAVAEICHRLDGLPLAIEIAAARVRMLPPGAMLTRLGSRLKLLTRGSATNARQQTLRDTIGWSYNLLEPEEQWSFRSFAVFEGGASVEAAESVLAALNPETTEAPLDLLEHLVDQSLLVLGTDAAGETRLRMLETVREFAWDELRVVDADAAAQCAHMRYYLDWIEGIREALTERRDGRAIRAVRTEMDNLRGALAWLDAHDGESQRLRLVNALFPYWRISGPYAEATTELSGAVVASTEGDPRQRAWALSALGWLAGARGDFGESITLNEQALALFEEVEDREQQEATLWQLATAAEWTSDYARARAFHRHRLALASADDTLAIARIEHDLGRLTFVEGRYDEAIELLTGAIAVFRTYADAQLIAHGLLDLSSAELLSGRASASLEHIAESITLLRTLQDEYGLAIAIVTRGRAEQLAGDYESAQATLEQSLADADRLGESSLRSLALYGLGVNAVALERWDEAVASLRAAFAVNQSIGDRRRTAEILEVLAQAAVGLDQIETAALLLGRAQRERLEGATTTPPAHLSRLERATETTRTVLGAERFAHLVAEGQSSDAATLIAAI